MFGRGGGGKKDVAKAPDIGETVGRMDGKVAQLDQKVRGAHWLRSGSTRATAARSLVLRRDLTIPLLPPRFPCHAHDHHL